MITHELILLGLLKESPKHGYEIKKEIKKILSLLTGVEIKSIYYPLGVLERKKLVAQRTFKQGKRPQRYVYELTPKGRARFEFLLTKSLLDFKRPQFSLDLSLYFLHHIKPAIAKRRLGARVFILQQLIKHLGQLIKTYEKKKPLSLTRILRHNLQMLEAETAFLADLTRTL